MEEAVKRDLVPLLPAEHDALDEVSKEGEDGPLATLTEALLKDLIEPELKAVAEAEE